MKKRYSIVSALLFSLASITLAGHSSRSAGDDPARELAKRARSGEDAYSTLLRIYNDGTAASIEDFKNISAVSTEASASVGSKPHDGQEASLQVREDRTFRIVDIGARSYVVPCDPRETLRPRSYPLCSELGKERLQELIATTTQTLPLESSLLIDMDMGHASPIDSRRYNFRKGEGLLIGRTTDTDVLTRREVRYFLVLTR